MRSPTSLLVALALAKLATAQDVTGAGTSGSTSGSACSWSSPCGSSAPCCSQYGTCGTGPSYCIAANPQFSYASSYVAPEPVCQSANYTFPDTSRIAPVATNASAYLGDATDYDFTLDAWDSGKKPYVANGQLALTLTENGGGTKLSTTRSILYGTIQASLKTVGANGIVTAFITMSGTKDEIDWEFVTNSTSTGQTNYFWEGVVVSPSHGGTSATTNSNSQFNVYGINWQPDQLQWLVNGKVVRTLTKASTYDKASGGYKYPQTPSRVQFSVWPVGVSTETEGNIEWGGGLIDWSDPVYTANGYYAAYVNWLSIDCADNSNITFQASNTTSSASSTSSSAGSKSTNHRRALHEPHQLFDKRASTINSYVYGSNDTTGQIATFTSDAGTVMNSDKSTGQNMIVAGGKTSSTGSSSSSPPTTAVGKLWAKLPLAAKVGIIVGCVLATLFAIVCIGTCCARSGNLKRKAENAQYAALDGKGPGLGKKGRTGGQGGQGDTIPLVEKSYTAQLAAGGAGGAAAGAASRSNVSLGSKASDRSYGNYGPSSTLGYSSTPAAYSTPAYNYDHNAAFRQGSPAPSPRGGGGGYQQPAYDGSNAPRPHFGAPQRAGSPHVRF